MSAWPESVWRAAALRGLDARARAELAAAGSLTRLEPGQLLFQQGEPADVFYVVAEGAVDLRVVKRGESEASVIRRATEGEALGEEATLRIGASRAMDAVCVERARVASVSMAVFRRATGRVGGGTSGEIMARVERTLRRAATLDMLRTASFMRDLPARDADVVLDAVEHVFVARGDVVFRQGDAATHVYVVADGMMKLEVEDSGRLCVHAYVTRGDVVGEPSDANTDGKSARTCSAVAAGPSWLLALPRDVFTDVVRRNAAAPPAPLRDAASATPHALVDAYRLSIARSLLVIDQDACVRCGHCAWACADAHEDGISRLVRRGDKVVTPVAESTDARLASLLIATSCQHCEQPACMVDCPTGAIVRDARGEVVIREDLCIGCGACAKACPWDNIQIAPRSKSSKRRLPMASHAAPPSEKIAVKCDLCRDIDSGPACVRACPTAALARVKPIDALPAVAAIFGKHAVTPLATKRPAWPWVVGGAGGALALARAFAGASAMTTGVVSGALVTLLVAYVAVKRRPRRQRVASRGRAVASSAAVAASSSTRIGFIAHLTLGALALGAIVAHGGAHVTPNVAGALALSFWATAVTGIVLAALYAVVPRRLTRLERHGTLPEDIAPRARALDDRAFALLSGQREGTKAIYARILRPYARAPWGPLALVAHGRTLHEEEARLRAQIDAVLATQGQRASARAELDELVRLVVAQRALPAERGLGCVLRAGLPVHVVSTSITMVLLVVHVAAALARAR